MFIECLFSITSVTWIDSFFSDPQLVDIAATAPIVVISNVGTSKVLIIWVNVQKVSIFTRNHSKILSYMNKLSKFRSASLNASLLIEE